MPTTKVTQTWGSGKKTDILEIIIRGGHYKGKFIDQSSTIMGFSVRISWGRKQPKLSNVLTGYTLSRSNPDVSALTNKIFIILDEAGFASSSISEEELKGAIERNLKFAWLSHVRTIQPR